MKSNHRVLWKMKYILMEHQFLCLIIVPLFQQPQCVLTPISILCILDFYVLRSLSCKIFYPLWLQDPATQINPFQRSPLWCQNQPNHLVWLHPLYFWIRFLRSGSTIILYYLYSCFVLIKLLRNQASVCQQAFHHIFCELQKSFVHVYCSPLRYTLRYLWLITKFQSNPPRRSADAPMYWFQGYKTFLLCHSCSGKISQSVCPLSLASNAFR